MLEQLSVYLPNKPGVLAGFFELMKSSSIFINAMTIAETDTYGLILMLVDKPRECISLLDENDHLFTVTKVIAIKLSDTIGGIYELSKLFGANNVNIEFIYSTIVKNEALLVIRVDDNEHAAKILRDKGYELINPEDLRP